MTTKHEILIPGLPDGYRLVSVNIKHHDRYRNDDGTSTIAGCDLVIERIKPRRIVLEETEVNATVSGLTYEVQWFDSICVVNQPKIWRVVEEE